MSILVFFPVVLGVVFLTTIALTTVYRARPHKIDNVILSARKLDISDLEVLLDAASEWNLRRSLSRYALQETQEDRMRLAKEYLRRVAFNTDLIHLWILQECKVLEGKRREKYIEHDALMIEALHLVTDLRLYSLAVSVRMWIWMALKAYRWPARFVPHMTDLRVQCGINVLDNYRRLTELAVLLSARYGENYRDRLVQAL